MGEHGGQTQGALHVRPLPPQDALLLEGQQALQSHRCMSTRRQGAAQVVYSRIRLMAVPGRELVSGRNRNGGVLMSKNKVDMV